MAGRGPRHYSNERPYSRDGHPFMDSPLHEISPNPHSGPLLTRESRLDLESPPNLLSSHLLSPSPQPLEQRIVPQQAEMEKLITENQRLSIIHVALRQELAAAQQDIVHLQQSRSAHETENKQLVNATQVALRQELADAKQEVGKLQETVVALRAERDKLLHANMEKSARLENEMKAMESLKVDFSKARFDREELLARLDYQSAELRKFPVKDQELATLRREVDELRHRHQQARMDFELQKKLNFEHLEHQQAMEKNIFAKTREIERLRADLINTERRHQAYLTEGSIPSSSFRTIGTASAREINFGPSQDSLKGSSFENKSVVDISSYAMGAEASGSLLPKAAPVNAALAGGWSKHAAPNGRPFYYNMATGATQWDKPPTTTDAVDANAMQQRRVQQAQGSSTPDINSEIASSQNQQKKPTVKKAQQAQPSVSPAPTLTDPSSQSGNSGVGLSVFGLSEGISDRDLASLFHPYGAILHAKVMVDTKSATPQIYGLVTMENAQAAEKAVAGVSGMLILGKRIKVEMQGQQTMQHVSKHGGVGPIRDHQRLGGSSGHNRPY